MQYSMKKKIHICLTCCLLLFSCKGIKNLTAKDNSTSSKTKQNSNAGNGVFLDNISVIPGTERVVINDMPNTNTVTRIYHPTVIAAGSGLTIESATQLHFKYATILDVPVETLTNIALLQDINYWWGTKYCMGGSTENCIDCSAFSHNVLLDVYNINIPRTAENQYDSCIHIKKDELQEGDLVFFQTTKRKISHVGVYITNNKFAHASVSNGVMISDLNDAYWKPKYRGAGRVKK